MNTEKIIQAWERCEICNTSPIAKPEETKAYIECEYTTGLYCRRDKLIRDTIKLLKEQELDIEALKNTIQGMVEGQCIIAGDKRVDVVLCKDCKHRKKDTCSAAAGMAFPPPDEWFCADGEREEGR